MKKKILLLVNILIIIGLLAFGGFYFKKYRDIKNNPPSAQQVAQDQADQTIADVGKLYDLPKDEKPSVATVSDKEKLKDQAFFSKAENGDITLIYSNAKLAILFRPSTKQIINVSSVTIQDNARVKVIGPESARASVIKTLGAAQVTASDAGDTKTTPESIIVVDLSGKNADQAKKVADLLKAKIGKIPEGENVPADTDILIIAGP